MTQKSGVPIAKQKMPRTLDELRAWIRQHLTLNMPIELELLEAVEEVLSRQRQLVEESKQEAIQALSEGFTGKMERLQRSCRKGRDRQQHRALLRGSRRRADRKVASRSKNQAAQFRLVHGAARVVPRRRAAGALVRRRRRRHHQLQALQRHARACASATASSSGWRRSCRIRSVPRTCSRSSASARRAISTRDSAATSSAS